MSYSVDTALRIGFKVIKFLAVLFKKDTMLLPLFQINLSKTG